jgi:gamma-glutamyl-gamma-aminobutyrate hydrolase PuuD
MADAVVIGGSRTDIDPASYGERRRAELADPDPSRDRQDIAVIRTALEQDIPIVGICRGHQLLNVAFGGTLHQDLAADHVVTSHPRRHSVRSLDGSFTRRVLGARAPVSSRHHQAVKRLGRGLRVVSLSDDGLIEAVELPRRRFALGVQFHPEDDPSASDRLLATALVDAAARRAA